MDDPNVNDRAQDLAVDGLLRETLREDGARDASLERMLARVRGDGAPAAPRSFLSWTFRTAAAAALLLIAGLLVTQRAPAKPLHVLTGEGQNASYQLEDRSVVRVTENTELLVRSSSQGMQVEMPQGGATFEVTKKEPGKSFQVATAYGDIVVHGTKFSATLDPGALVVRVEEGCVEVRNAFGRARLYPGEHAVLTQDRAPDKKEKLFLEPIKVEVPPIASDPSVKYDYDIVYVRARRAGDEVHKRFYTDFSQPVTLEPGADLMLLNPDGKEELLVEGGKGSITDPMVSFDGQWVYYSHLYNEEKHNQWSPPAEGS
ncbi:MAG: FecR domain-containing protein, partial [Planctomycetes bacterium]|nr:FecR domain-containing protein [Planctomycetota bacterium]